MIGIDLKVYLEIWRRLILNCERAVLIQDASADLKHWCVLLRKGTERRYPFWTGKILFKAIVIYYIVRFVWIGQRLSVLSLIWLQIWAVYRLIEYFLLFVELVDGHKLPTRWIVLQHWKAQKGLSLNFLGPWVKAWPFQVRKHIALVGRSRFLYCIAVASNSS
jgi:hypothetical protein